LTKSTSLKWARYVEGTGEDKCKEGTVRKRNRKNFLGRPKRGWEGVNWQNVAQDRTGGGKKYTLVQALSLCTGRTAHRGSRGIAVP
jgi:hypothetical protein